MEISLSKFKESDFELLKSWCSCIQSDLFMSRVTPDLYEMGGAVSGDILDWYLINQNGQPIGTIWVEKSNVRSEVAKIGILLGSKRLFGKGIGTHSILLAIKSSSKNLKFNKIRLNVRKSNDRAIGCYQKCGFSIIGDGKKINKEKEEIEFYIMQLNV